MTESVKKRKYVSPTRQAKAEATRARIIDASAKLFLEKGYGRTSTALIGKTAKTSEASVFAAFGSKANLLVEVVFDRVGRSNEHSVRDLSAWQAVSGQQDKLPACMEMARLVRRAHDRSWQLLALAAAAAQDDPAVAEAARRGAEQRHARARWFVREIIGETGPDADRKADEVWTLTSVENYRRLVVERLWSPEQFEYWLAKMLVATLT